MTVWILRAGTFSSLEELWRMTSNPPQPLCLPEQLALAHDFESSSATLPPGAIGVEIPGFPTFPDQVEDLFFAKEPGFDPYVDFYLGSLLTDAGGAIPLVGAFSCDGTCYELNSNDSNTLVGTAVSEPSTIVLTVPILGLLFGALRRRQIHARSAVLAHAGLE